MKNKIGVLVFIALMGKITSVAQISPPGLGRARTANWLALGLRNRLNKNNTWQSLSYVGLGRKSSPTDFDPLLKQAIWVFNQEFYHQFSRHSQYSFALSYRRQDQYMDDAPYKHDQPAVEQEFRLYGRIYYTIPIHRFKLTGVYRQEFRKFYGPDFAAVEEDFQLRSRFRIQLSTDLNKSKTQKLTLSSENIFSASKESGGNNWTNFQYKESRFSLYYTVSLKKLPVTVDVGYMNNLIGASALQDIHYFALDVIVNNPFD